MFFSTNHSSSETHVLPSTLRKLATMLASALRLLWRGRASSYWKDLARASRAGLFANCTSIAMRSSIGMWKWSDMLSNYNASRQLPLLHQDHDATPSHQDIWHSEKFHLPFEMARRPLIHSWLYAKLCTPVRIQLVQHYMGGEEESYPHGSAEQAVPRPQPSSFSLQRENPNLPRIHADDQDKKTICLFWSLLLGLLILMAILANYAVPSIYIKNNLGRSLSGSGLASCNNPSGISGKKISCGGNALYYGEVVVGWGPINQFGLLYLQARPSNMSQAVLIQQKYKLRLIPLNIRPQGNSPFDFEVAGTPEELNATIDFSSSNADLLYGDDGETVIGYRYLLAIIIHFDQQPFAEQVMFSQALNLNGTTLRLQSYAINKKFTTYTIVVRYVFFAIAIVALILYIVRFVKVPSERRTIEQKMVAIASVLLVMFNDPFYPITILKPNGVSAFFSLIFVINLIAFLLLLWLVAADRIYFQDGQLATVQLTKKKMAYVGLVWALLVVCLMVYTMQQVNNTPLVPNEFNRSYTVARVVIGLVFFIGIVYIAARFIRSCMAPQGRTWRSMLFMTFSCIFILAVFIIVVSNALAPYNYNGSSILVVYSLVNIYVYYLQYMFTVTREETERIVNPPAAPEQQDQYDVLSVGTIDLVDVNLDDQEELSKGSAAGRKATGRQLEEMSSFQVDQRRGQ